MFHRESRLIITESVVESTDSVIELANSTAASSPDLARIGAWVWVFSGTYLLTRSEYSDSSSDSSADSSADLSRIGIRVQS